jgi:hypothetical protein
VLGAQLGGLVDNVGFNLAALQLLQLQLEERDNVKLFKFSDLAVQSNKSKTEKKLKKKRKVRDIALIQTA